jgi:hypothetical protein
MPRIVACPPAPALTNTDIWPNIPSGDGFRSRRHAVSVRRRPRQPPCRWIGAGCCVDAKGKRPVHLCRTSALGPGHSAGLRRVHPDTHGGQFRGVPARSRRINERDGVRLLLEPAPDTGAVVRPVDVVKPGGVRRQFLGTGRDHPQRCPVRRQAPYRLRLLSMPLSATVQ